MFFPYYAMLAPPRTVSFYVGTYTSATGSQGIYRTTLDLRSGRISKPKLAIASANPSYLALHPSGRFLYSVHEDNVGSVSAYAIGRGHTLRLLNTLKVHGGAPCHLSVDPKGRNLLVASYTGGYVTCFPILTHGSLGLAATVIHHQGSGPNKDRQEGPHSHWASADPHGRYAYSCDLGTDLVQTYRLGVRSGTLVSSSNASVAPGDGPRHGAFHPNHRFLYINGEMGNTVTVFKILRRTGRLEAIQAISTLTPHVPLKGTSTAEIQCHPNGKWVYVSNRGHDSIAVYRIRRNGKLKLVQIEKLSVREPRGFEIDPSGRWLVVGGQKSNDLTSLEIDRRSGKLHPSCSKVDISSPVCIAFVRR